MRSPRTRWESSTRPGRELLTAAACVLLTGVHFGYRQLTEPTEPAPIRISTLDAGAVVRWAALGAVPAEATCRIVITFSPDCPFCKRAAERERTADRNGAYASSIWVTAEPRESLEAFSAGLPPSATRIVDAALYRSLGVRAVPGLYLLDAAGRLRWVGPYRGDEDSELLSTRCTHAPESDVDVAG